jgi:hypothetical protein
MSAGGCEYRDRLEHTVNPPLPLPRVCVGRRWWACVGSNVRTNSQARPQRVNTALCSCNSTTHNLSARRALSDTGNGPCGPCHGVSAMTRHRARGCAGLGARRWRRRRRHLRPPRPVAAVARPAFRRVPPPPRLPRLGRSTHRRVAGRAVRVRPGVARSESGSATADRRCVCVGGGVRPAPGNCRHGGEMSGRRMPLPRATSHGPMPPPPPDMACRRKFRSGRAGETVHPGRAGPGLGTLG